MNWLETTIYTSKQGLEIVTGILLQLGVTGFVIQDPDDYDEFLTLQGKTWDYMDEDMKKLKDCPTSIKIYLADNMQGNEMLVEIRNTLARLKSDDKEGLYGHLSIELDNVNEEDWANNWKKYFKPFKVGNRFVIKPSWETYNEATERHILEIDPNSSFGTGQHYSTQLCLEQLEKLEVTGKKVLDMGCGSGILSIAALLLGAQEVIAVDIDQNSVEIARENFYKNHLAENRFKTYCGNVLADDDFAKTLGIGYDIVLANIVADVIIAMKDLLKGFVREGGTLVASGVIGERAEEVKYALESVGFHVYTITEKNDWVALAAISKEE